MTNSNEGARFNDWEYYKPIEENPEQFMQKRMLVAQSPDRRYRVLAGKKYRNLLLHDTKENKGKLLERDVPYSIEQPVLFVDIHTFCIDTGDRVDFYNAHTGEHVDFLEMQFGHKDGQKRLLGFSFDTESNRFSALYVNEEPTKPHGHKYWAALFNREGRLLDHFRTDMDLMQSWGKIVSPHLMLQGNQITVTSKKLTADYILTFYEHTTELRDKSFH